MSHVPPPAPKKKKCLSRYKIMLLAKRVMSWYVRTRPLVGMDSGDIDVEEFSVEDAKRLIRDTPDFALEGLDKSDAHYDRVARVVVRLFLFRFSWMEPMEILQDEVENLLDSYKVLEKEHEELIKRYEDVPKKRPRLPRAAKKEVAKRVRLTM